MDALYPRLLVDDFEPAARFYAAALRELLGIEPVKLLPAAEYANWDLGGEGALVVMGRARIAEAIGSTGPSGQDAAMLVFRVDDVDAAAKTLGGLGATLVAGARDRPEWGPGLRTAHLRDPAGNLLELQSY
ncbi:VOC family protein [Actinomadura decatromicini]|uniref:Glyoxalase/bleomycin resistance/extradiol dioxygenase family protein n=1 Tax=Actinomadura decatromicini TaxID=2604572 RepID=A0A5D3F693_9ACTN|nr:VOC family protein [Actinomadura decatromicini]TYK43448.1 glyoxalase/bleomycin resistance/extradiol dioxygenase family protein [Actinomadura decatromicini]